jgi:uncharacterized protein DUF6235
MTAERRRRRLSMGMACLEQWAVSASQAQKNSVYEALFAVSDGSVRQSHKVLDDVQRNGEYFVLVRDNLVVKVGIHPFNTFSIVYIGSLDEAPDIDLDVA